MLVVHMNGLNSNQRILNPKDINYANTGASYMMNGTSPNKKTNSNSNNQNGGGNGTSNKNNDGYVEKIQVTIPNPLLMPTASVQMQFNQELVRNVLARVDDIFHLKQIVDIKNNKLKDKAIASNDQDSTNIFDEVKSKEVQRINKENSILLRFKDARIEDKLLRKQIVKGCKKI